MKPQSGKMMVSLLLLMGASIAAQTPNADSQVWPSVTAAFDLRPKTRLQLYEELRAGDSYRQWTTGVMLNYRIRRRLDLHRPNNNDEEEHTLVIGGGYENVRTTQNGKTKNESRIVVQGTPRFTPGAGFLITDRNRIEFRWNDGTYNFRYRNMLIIDHPLKAGAFHFTPYASGELFYDRNHHSWNENQYAFGAQLPYKKILMLDTYYLHQNCTTCNPNPINAFGVTLNLYLRTIKK